MPDELSATLAATTWELSPWLYNVVLFLKVLIGFSIIICVHELGHFLLAKWVGVRVDRFAVGFGTRLLGFRKGEGFTFGNRPDYNARELVQRGYGETDYCLKLLPFGGYVKMLGQDDIIIDEKTGDVQLTDDPRAFTNRPVGQRMAVVSAGVIFNLLFAALLLMCVFLIGKPEQSPVIGIVNPDSPAEGKLLPGDRILEINGSQTDSFKDIILAPVLSSGPLTLKVQRNGEVLPEPIVVEPKVDPRVQARTLEVAPLFTNLLGRDGDPVGDLPYPRAGDRILAINGQPAANAMEIVNAFALSRGAVLKLTVQQPDPDHPDAPPRTAEVFQRARLEVAPADAAEVRDGNMVDNRHVLGMRQRRSVNLIEPGSPAEDAGFKLGDVIAQWDTIANPLFDEILQNIYAHPGEAIPVVVERNGRRVELTVTPRRPFSLFSEVRPRVGLDFGSRSEEDRPVVADVAPDTPAAALRMPRGSVLTAIDGQPVKSWFDVINMFLDKAGKSVEVRYRTGADEVAGNMEIPGSIVNELGLPPTVRIWEIDGQKSATILGANDKRRTVTLPANAAVKALLAEKVGQTVTVRYSARFPEPSQLAEFAVRPDNIDPWQLRLNYAYDVQKFEILTEHVSAKGNPFTALTMGIELVVEEVVRIYQMINQMLIERNVGVQNVSGPVGIVGVAIQQARLGMVDLLFFLSLLSINLAVINFLPLPVMDGGLMVFLLIEKIKGKPLSIKTQMISTLVGLAVILLIGLFVTVQDIGRFFGS